MSKILLKNVKNCTKSTTDKIQYKNFSTLSTDFLTKNFSILSYKNKQNIYFKHNIIAYYYYCILFNINI